MASNRIDVILELIDATLAECAPPGFAIVAVPPATPAADSVDADAA